MMRSAQSLVGATEHPDLFDQVHLVALLHRAAVRTLDARWQIGRDLAVQELGPRLRSFGTRRLEDTELVDVANVWRFHHEMMLARQARAKGQPEGQARCIRWTLRYLQALPALGALEIFFGVRKGRHFQTRCRWCRSFSTAPAPSHGEPG